MEPTTMLELIRAPFADLVTFRRDGRGVHTTVLAAPRDGGLLIRTHHTAGKLKRLGRNSLVEVAPVDSRGRPLGPPQQGTARILPARETADCLQLLHRRHPIAGRIGTWIRHLRGMRDVFIQVSAHQENVASAVAVDGEHSPAAADRRDA